MLTSLTPRDQWNFSVIRHTRFIRQLRLDESHLPKALKLCSQLGYSKIFRSKDVSGEHDENPSSYPVVIDAEPGL